MLQSLIRRFFPAKAAPAPAPGGLAEIAGARGLLPGKDMLRLGTPYGGWNIPAANALDASSVCYCVGAGEDISFDCALASRYGCTVRVIDPTPRAVAHFEQLSQAVEDGRRFPINNKPAECYDITRDEFSRITFLPYGVAADNAEMKFFLPRNKEHVSCSMVNIQGTEDYFVATCRRLADIMREQGDGKLALLKLDIEGAEYSVIKDLVEAGALPDLFLIEFDEGHTPMDADAPKRIATHVKMLEEAGMRCVFVEGCNATFVRSGEGR